jgi:hypothetical protein
MALSNACSSVTFAQKVGHGDFFGGVLESPSKIEPDPHKVMQMSKQ